MTLGLAVALLGVGLALASPASAATTLQDTVSYTYDALGRLQTVSYPNGTTITYTYDIAGNRLGQQVTCGSGGC